MTTNNSPLYLPKGGLVGLPPAGEVAVFVDTDGTLKQMDSNGTATAVVAGFTSDTIINLPNAGSTPVKALELVTSLTSNTPGSEASQFVINLLTGGAQVAAMTVGPNQALFRAGTRNVPGLAISATNIGFSYGVNGSDGNSLLLSVDPTNNFWFSYGSASQGYGFMFQGTPGSGFPAAGGMLFAQAAGSFGPQLFSNSWDIVLGNTGALATAATTGFVQIPSMPGIPTGIMKKLVSGMVGIVFNTAANKLQVTKDGTNWIASGVFA